MKKYNKQIKCDERGQIVIPRDIRSDLGIDEGTGFFIYVITDEGILLKKIESEPLSSHSELLNEIEAKSDKLKLKKENLKKSVKNYNQILKGNLEII